MELTTLKKKKWILNYLFRTVSVPIDYLRVTTTPSGIIRETFCSFGDISEYVGHNWKELKENHSKYTHCLFKPLPVYCEIIHFYREDYKSDKTGPGFFSIYAINDIVEYCSHSKIDKVLRFRKVSEIDQFYPGYTNVDPLEQVSHFK